MKMTEEELSELSDLSDLDEKKESSILFVPKRPRKVVENWGPHHIGFGLKQSKDLTYFYRPVFNQLWENSYIGVGDNDAKSVDTFFIPRQHLFYLSILLHEALMNGNFIQAAYLMIAVSQNPQHLPEQLWLCGMEILKMCSSEMIATSRKFQILMSRLYPHFQCQMVLDMAFEILRRGNDAQEAYQFLMNNMNNKKMKYNVLFRAYLGMFEYSLWKTEMKNKSRLNESESEETYHEGVTGSINELMHYNAKRALAWMSAVLSEKGIWDVFVLKMVEIQHYYNQVDEAISMLDSYREKNMENPNTHRYLYWYLKKTDRDKDKQFTVLQYLVKIDPTEDLTMEYIEMLQERGKNCQVIDLLFKRLDHASQRYNHFDWKMLYKLFKTYKKSPMSDEWAKMRTLLEERADWWPKYHFNTSNIRSDGQGKHENKQLKKYKTKIAHFYQGQGLPLSTPYASDSNTDSQSAISTIGNGAKRNWMKESRGFEDEPMPLKMQRQ